MADFYCDELNLVVEVDGEVHLGRENYDIERDVELQRRGVKVLRFRNEQVLNNIEQVLALIRAAAEELRLSPPSPLGEGGGGER